MAPGFTRRQAIELVGVSSLVGVAGCTGGPEPSTATAGPHPAERLEFRVTDTRPVGDDGPGGVTLALINNGQAPITILYRRGLEAPFSGIHGQQVDGDEQLALFPSDESAYRAIPCQGSGDSPVPATKSDGCWTVDCAVATPFDAVGLHEIEAGQRFAVSYVVLDPGTPPCLPAGTYRFTETVPAGIGGGLSMSEPTYPRELSDQLGKRLTIALAADGTVTGDAQLTRPAAASETA